MKVHTICTGYTLYILFDVICFIAYTRFQVTVHDTYSYQKHFKEIEFSVHNINLV
jgi:hypothetical protein